MHFSTLMIAPFAAGFASAICPGFNFGVGNRQDLGNGISKWTVYDDSCRAVDSLTTSKNPCTTGTFGCTPAPVTFNQYTNTFSKLVYACRPDPNAGACSSDAISVCCRNDGN